MTSLLSNIRWPVADRLQDFFWRYPQWWSRALYSFAWAAMLLCGWRHAGHEVHHWMTFAQELTFWMSMVAAMMLPLVMDRVWFTAASSLWARRHRSIAGFLVGYFAPWLVLGMAAAGLREVSWAHSYVAPAAAFLSAALWQLTSTHRRALTACHRTYSLAPLGWRADRDCVLFGGAIGVACVVSCWPLMLACALAGHSLIAMVGGMAVSAAERWWVRPRSSAMLAATLALAGYYVAFAVLDK